MAETEEKKHKTRIWSILKSILKWAFIVIVSILLVVSIVFQAPWKVITLFAIFLLACTALPKAMRKWFWAGFGVVIIALAVWVFLPENNEGWQPYTFDDEIAELQAKYAIPDEENAAKIYLELLETHPEIEPLPEKDTESEEIIEKFTTELMEKGTAKLTDKISDSLSDYKKSLEYITENRPWTSEEYPEAAEWLDRQQDIIDTLIQASKIENCRFSIPFDSISLGKSMERLSPIRQWSFLLIRAANNDIADGRIDQALEKNFAVLQMAKHQHQQPMLVDLLVAMAFESVSRDQLKKRIMQRRLTDKQLLVIKETLKKVKHHWNTDFLKRLECEKLFVKNLWAMLYEVNSKDNTRLSRDPTAAMRVEFKDTSAPTYWQKKLIKTGIILQWFYMPSTPQKLTHIIDEGYETLYAMAEPEYDWQKEPKKIPVTSIFSTSARLNYSYLAKLIADMLKESYYAVHKQYIRNIADKRGVLLSIALKRYKNKTGDWPESLEQLKNLTALEDLTDPMNGDSFVYKLTDDEFILYSKGKNGIDEKGNRSEPADDWPIWPPPSDEIWKKSKK